MKISFLGAGQVGGQSAFLTAFNGLADVYLYDSKPGLAKGKALDIGQSLSFAARTVEVFGSEDIQFTADSDVLVITAGLGRKPGMTREDLLNLNALTIRSLLQDALKYSPNAVVIIVTNPVNTMTYLATQVSGLATGRIIGMAGLLDNARFTYFIAQETGCQYSDVKSYVIGDHGDHAVPLISQTTVSGRPLAEWLDPDQLIEISVRTRLAGTQIVDCLQQGSAFHAPGMAVMRMLKSIIQDDGEPILCSVSLNGEFGASAIVASVPVRVGKNGVKEIVEFELSVTEKNEFKCALDYIQKNNRTLHRFMPDLTNSSL